MMKLSVRIAQKVSPNYANRDDLDARTRIGLLEGWVSVVLNTVLFGIKISLGLMVGSVALIADAVHTLADSFTSIVVVFGFRMAKKPPDKEHPFGHGRMESIAAVAIAVLLGVVAVEAFRAALNRTIHWRDFELHVAPWVTIAVGLTLIIKEWLSRFATDLGNMIDSDALHADAWHHRSDVFATGMVLVAFVAAFWDIHWLDGPMGIGVAAVIAWAAVDIMRSAINPLLGERAPESMYQQIEEVALSVPGVLGVHDLLVHRYGTTNIISLHIEVSAADSALHLHRLSDEIEARLGRRFPGHAIVHVDPLNRDHANYEDVKRILTEVLSEEKEVISFHDLRLVGEGERFKVVFDVATSAGRDDQRMTDLRQKALGRLRKHFPHVRVVMDVEPPYFRNAPRADVAPPGQAAALPVSHGIGEDKAQ